MALAGLADYGSSSEDEREEEKPLKATMEVEVRPLRVLCVCAAHVSV